MDKIYKLGIGIGLCLLACLISFLIISGIYYLFTLIMMNFFNITIPFTWTYACGIWLIYLLIRLMFGSDKR